MKYKKILCNLCVGAVALTACTDTWDEHYNSSDGTQGVPTQTLWELIQQDKTLEQFARVIKATHYDDDLQGCNMHSVWAAAISKEEADMWIDAYRTDSLAGLKDEDNKAIVRFVHNHMCLYNRTVSSFTLNDTIKMLNGKYKYLSHDNISGHPLELKNKLATNGVLYKIGEPLPFFKNVYEELMDNEAVSDFADFIKEYNKYTLDVAASVPGDVIDGKIHYLDSVTILSNSYLQDYKCFINREDSTYLLFAPTNEVWQAQYERYKQYYVFPSTVINGDSLQDDMAKRAVFMSRTFNISQYVNPEWQKPDEQQRDSIMSTSYKTYDWENNVFYKPFADGGLLAGRQSIQCSNGSLVIDDTDYSIDARHTFLYDRTYNTLQLSWVYGTDDEKNNPNDAEKLNQNKAEYVYVYYTDSIDNADGTRTRLHMNNDWYVLFSGSNPVLPASTKFAYSLPNVLSGVYYNVYFVFAPPVAVGDPYKNMDTYEGQPLPIQFRAYRHDLQANGKMMTGKGAATYINNPENGTRDFTTIPGIVDTVCILQAHQYSFTGLGGSSGSNSAVANICFESNVSSSDNGKKYTRNIRVNSVILRPFETKEAADEDYEKYVAARNLKKE